MALIARKIMLGYDYFILTCLGIAFFCLPFGKAGMQSFIGIAVFLWLIKRLYGFFVLHPRQCLVPRTALNKFIGIFLLANILSLLVSIEPTLTLRAIFAKRIYLFLLYFCLVDIISTFKRLQYMLVWVLIAVFLIIIDGFKQYFTGYDFFQKNLSYRLSASFVSPNGLGGWLIVIIPLLIGIIFLKNKKNIFKGDYYKLFFITKRLVLIVLTIILFVFLLLTLSRGAWLGLFFGFLTVLIIFTRDIDLKKRILICLISCLCVFVFLKVLPVSIKGRIKSTVDIRHDDSTLIRFGFWKEAINIMKDYPWGCGLNTYSAIVPKYKLSPTGGGYVHNSFLQIAVEIGIAGLITFLLLLWKSLKVMMRSYYVNRDPLLLGMLSGIVGFLIHSFFDTHFFALQLVTLFWFILGLAMARVKMLEF